MKLLPFTEACRRELLEQGYTHIVLKRVIEPKDRDYISQKELHVYEAYKDGHPVLSRYISERIDSEYVKDMVGKGMADYCIVTGIYAD